MIVACIRWFAIETRLACKIPADSSEFCDAEDLMLSKNSEDAPGNCEYQRQSSAGQLATKSCHSAVLPRATIDPLTTNSASHCPLTSMKS